MANDKSLVILGNVYWTGRRQRPQHIYSRIVDSYEKVFYVNTLTSGQETTCSLLEKNIYQVILAGNGQRVDQMPPKLCPSLLSELTLFLGKKGYLLSEAVVIVDIPYWSRIMEGRIGKKLIYSCMDYVAGFSDLDKEQIERDEEKLFKLADLTIFSSRALVSRFGGKCKRHALIRNGCEFDLFHSVLEKEYPVPGDIKGMDNGLPIVGYIGAIADWFDAEAVFNIGFLLNKRANIVLIGDYFHGNIGVLRNLPNVFILGEKPYSSLPAYLQCFDICMIPFKENALTECTNPVKLYEYMAAGKPVVSTPLPELALICPGLVEVTSNPLYFANIILYLIANGFDKDRTQERVEWARQNDWDNRAKFFQKYIDDLDFLEAPLLNQKFSLLPMTTQELVQELTSFQPNEAQISDKYFLNKRLMSTNLQKYLDLVGKASPSGEAAPDIVDLILEEYIIGDQFTSLLKEGDRILDLGSFKGAFWYSPKYTITAVDINDDLKDKLPDYVRFIVGDAQYSSVDGLFDAIYACHILEHVADPRKLIHNAYLHTRPGGYIYLGFPEGAGFPNRIYKSLFPGHIKDLSLEDVVSYLEEAGYKVQYTFEWPDSFSWMESHDDLKDFAPFLKAKTRELDYKWGTSFSRYGYGVVAKRPRHMSNETQLTTISPILNEEFFLPLYLDSALSYADQVVLSDGGSTDSSLDIIRSYDEKYPGKITLIHHSQTGDPYTIGWSENIARNGLLDAADGDYVLWLDVDEMMHDNFIEVYSKYLDPNFNGIYSVPFVPFWGGLFTRRINDPNDPHWDKEIYRMWRNRPGVRYNNAQTHCTLQFDGKGSWLAPHKKIEDTIMFHFHYVLGERMKFGDNRRGDVGDWDNTGIHRWNFLNEINEGEYPFNDPSSPVKQYRLRTEPYIGPHPKIIKERFIDALQK
jgi:glycosyltransferase involved in cell wall biosynthesis/SAM-dependent methyltransferase